MKTLSVSFLILILVGSACEAMETQATITDRQYQPPRSIEHPAYFARECSPADGEVT